MKQANLKPSMGAVSNLQKLVDSVGICVGLPRGVFRQPSRMQILAFLKCRTSLIDSVEIGETNRQNGTADLHRRNIEQTQAQSGSEL